MDRIGRGEWRRSGQSAIIAPPKGPSNDEETHTMEPLRQDLLTNGYSVVQGALDPPLLASVRRISAGILERVSAEHRAQNRSQGSLVNTSDYPDYAALIGNPRARAAFDELGFVDTRFSSGYLISKPPGGPPLFWHQDWWGWDDQISYTETVAQVFLMYYLTDTSPENGCLRVVPGSHRRKHSLHDADQAHDEALSRVDDPNDPLYGALAEEKAVPVRAGDLVIGDSRLLHAAYANQSSEERSLITLWYHPDFSSLPAGMRARIREIHERRGVDTDAAAADSLRLDDWPREARDLVVDLLPPPVPGVQPHPWNRKPNWDLAG